MRKTTIIALASTFVAASASAALAQPGRYYPGDHLLDYDPVNQAYQWQLNNDGGSTQRAAQSQSGYASFAAAPRTTRRVREAAPSVQTGVQTWGEDPWTKAREDDSLNAGNGS